MVQMKAITRLLIGTLTCLYIPHGSDESLIPKPKGGLLDESLYPTWFR